MRKFYILSLIFLFGFAFCLTNGFADEAGDFDKKIKDANGDLLFEGNFDFPTAEGPEYIQGTPEFQRDPELIIGSPDFEKMRNLPPNSQDYQLGTKVGWFVVPQRNNPGRVWICTGFLVGPDLLMTNHHCIHDDFGLLPLSNARIYMDYYQDRDVDPTAGGVTARVASILRMDGTKDYALLRLDTPIGNTYGWLDLDTTTRVNSSQSVKLISHPRGRSKEIVRRNSEIVDIPAGHPLANVPSALAYLADSEGGSSGSPVFLRDGTGVIAIHHSGWRRGGVPHFNSGTLMSHIVPEIQQYLPRSTTPDLVVDAPRITQDWLRPGEPFTLSTTVRNQGGVAASPTTLRFYQSVDNIITTSDVEVGIVFVSSLEPFATSAAEIRIPAPAALGAYYYGACADPVTDEDRTDNNCSTAVKLTVSDGPPVFMYWTDWGTEKIQQANLDGTDIKDIVTTGLSFPKGIAVDVTGGKMYWTDSGTDKIQRANLNGSNIEDLVTGLSAPDGIAVDVTGEKMYWTDWLTGKIQRANLDGTNIEDIVTNVFGPEGIALDVAARQMYWTSWLTGKIQRANLDGTNIVDLVTGLSEPRSIALDVAARQMYWTNEATENIQRANLDGTNIETLVTGASGLQDIALDVAGGKMYWVEQIIGPGDKIRGANLDGTNIVDLVTTGLSLPEGLTLGVPPVSGPGPPSPPLAFNPPTIANQTYPVDAPITPLQLPVATGGTPPYTYRLSPIPDGLDFNTATRLLTGTPTTVGTTNATYIATDATGTSAATLNFTIEIEAGVPVNEPLDVNGDGQVTVIDLAIVALFYGTQVPSGVSLPADVNADGVVDLLDLTAVAQGIDAAGGNDGINALSQEEVEEALLAAIGQVVDLENVAEAPMHFSTRPDVLSRGTAYVNVTHALADARHLAVSDVLSAFLVLLAEMGAIPEMTALLPNYPNPFNPETWIPYHLATEANVTLTIYDVRGSVVRTLVLGHQPAGVYESRGRAAYWDGKNQIGETVASGLYFYTLSTESTRDSVTAGDFTATRKLLIAK